MSAQQQLIRLLADLGLINTQDNVEISEHEHYEPLRLFAKRGIFEEMQAIQAVAERMGIEYVDLVSPAINDKLCTQQYASTIEPDMCWTHKLVPLYEEKDHVVMAFANPMNFDAKKLIEFAIGRPVKMVIAEEIKICHLLSEHFPHPVVHCKQKEDDAKVESIEVMTEQVNYEDLDATDVDAPPIVRLAGKILSDAVSEDASDIHLEPTQEHLEVRFRIDGVLRPIFSIPKRIQLAVTSRLKLLAGMDIAEKRRPQDGRIRIKVVEEELDLRVSTVPTSFGEKVVIRLLRSEPRELTLSRLGMPQELEQMFISHLNSSGRMLLVTGPTGSGKTTTLYTALSLLRDGTKNIETVEDPIEYRIAGINQIQVNEAANITFANTLRSILRQDPDIIMIGEIRDFETADIALQAAQTGHLVLSTLHTNDAPSAVSRLLNLGVDPFVLGESLAGVLAQRLVRKICKCCAEPMDERHFERHGLIAEKYNISREELSRGKGCANCRFTGYSGRIGIFSYFSIVPEIATLISKKAPLSECIAVARSHGYIDLDEASLELLRSGVTTLDEVRPYLHTRVSLEDGGKIHHYKRGKPSLLLVEEQCKHSDEISMLLQADTLKVVQAENLEEGINKVRAEKPGMILCGPSFDPEDLRVFVESIRKDVPREELVIAILSEHPSDRDEIELLNLGIDEFIPDSSNRGVLLARLNKYLR